MFINLEERIRLPCTDLSATPNKIPLTVYKRLTDHAFVSYLNVVDTLHRVHSPFS
jgi:hypothetical protein